MPEWPTLSIVIPSYNKAPFLGRTLDSILAQDYPRLEILIEDGGSADGSVELIRRYAREHPDVIRWVSERDEGQLDAINKGLRKASGELVAEIDGDDVYRPGAFRRAAECFRARPDCLWAVGKGGVIDAVDRPVMGAVTSYKNLLLRLNRKSLLHAVNYIVQPAVFFRRSVFETTGYFTGNRRFVMEYELWLRLAELQMPAVIPEYLADYRLTLGTISSTQAESLLAEDLALARRYTRNPLVLGTHRFHNGLRKAILAGVKRLGSGDRFR